MKGARFEERFGNGKLPAIGANGRGVRNNDNQSQFLIARVIAQDEARATLAVKPRSTSQTSPRPGFAMFSFQVVEHQEPLVGALVAVGQNALAVLDFEHRAGDFASVAAAEFGQLLDDFGFAHG